jgi:glycerol-3-phosphate cytidylyltransferase-like family protein
MGMMEPDKPCDPSKLTLRDGEKIREEYNSSAERLGVTGLKDLDVQEWNLGEAPDYAQIVTLEQFARVIRPTLDDKKIVATSGGFDPIQPGHSSCIIDSKQYGDIVVVIVNGDWFLETKKNPKGDVGMENLRQRSQIAAHIRGVDFVIPFEIEGDSSVSEALRLIRPHIFTKGGDRTGDHNTPEGKVCRDLGIEVQYGVGSRKVDSSSWIAEAYFLKRLQLLAETLPEAQALLNRVTQSQQ